MTSAGPLMLSPNVLGSRYQDFRSYPDGSVAYPAPGSTASKIKILRVLGCSGRRRGGCAPLSGTPSSAGERRVTSRA